MATFNGILGAHPSGKVGKVVYYTSNGINCVRSLPKKTELPPSEKQQQQRQRFLAMNKLCNQFKDVVIPQIFNRAAKGMTGRNLFIQTNREAFDKEGYVNDPGMIKVSVGKLLLPSDLLVQRQQPGSSVINAQWTENHYKGGIAFWDELLVISYGQGLFSLIKYTGLQRGKLKGSFELPPLKAVATHVFLFFASLDRTQYSESICFALDAN